jgi:prepilin-type N-terminal cleavage/methylation domain-containing protein
MRTSRGAVTLIEVLMVLVILALLVAIAYPRFVENPSRRANYDARAALERLKDAEADYYTAHHAYTSDLTALGTLGFSSSSDVQITIGGTGLASGAGWNASASTSSPPYVRCYIGVGADSVIDTVHVANGGIVCH